MHVLVFAKKDSKDNHKLRKWLSQGKRKTGRGQVFGEDKLDFLNILSISYNLYS